jgi:hypothetical protein
LELTRDHSELPLRDAQLQRLLAKKIFFGHQSVGDNILQGIRDWRAEDSRLQLPLIRSADPAAVSGPALVETHIGENGNAASKDAAMAAILGQGMGAGGGIALYKYCYVDIDSQTNISQLFENYRRHFDHLKAKNPSVEFVHVTVPLTRAEPESKAWVKSLLGKPLERDRNAKRNEFNELLRDTYAVRDPIFDVAEVESTHPGGSRSFLIHGGRKVYTLVPEFTTDGGHLNALGRKAVARHLLLVLGQL